MNQLLDVNLSYYDTLDGSVNQNLTQDLIHLLKQIDFTNRTLVVLCIGTDRATGDCLGPLVGEKLRLIDDKCVILGTLSAPVHALNIRQVIRNIYERLENPFVIAVDAALGIPRHVGYITLSDSPIAPGKGVNKKLPAIGDISITGIVNVSGSNSHNLLQSTRLHTVMLLADCIANAISNAIDYFDVF